ncbi:MAG: SDR family oxidoreductase [Alphaproteobacteria bacterium]|nr:SDR family oxidoreductase [Alphaproteobacteria bacterium]
MSHPLFDLTGRVALVTGASRGLGFAMAEALAKAGASVVLNARNKAELDAAAKKLGGEALPFDVTDEAACVAAVADIAKRRGRLDILVSNAGSNIRAPLLEYKTADFDTTIGQHLRAGFVLGREAAKVMTKASKGRIIYTTSLTAHLGRPSIVAYTAAKTALEGMIRQMAVELAPSGVLVNGIAPGYFLTELNRPLIDNKEFNSMIIRRTPLGRWGDPAELGGACLLLASDAGSFLTGQTLVVDGGMSVSL